MTFYTAPNSRLVNIPEVSIIIPKYAGIIISQLYQY